MKYNNPLIILNKSFDILVYLLNNKTIINNLNNVTFIYLLIIILYYKFIKITYIIIKKILETY